MKTALCYIEKRIYILSVYKNIVIMLFLKSSVFFNACGENNDLDCYRVQ